jgi:cyclic pyranopterin phosphate synthase
MNTRKTEQGGARVLSLNISDRTGVVKRPVASAELRAGGVVGDAHFGLSELKQVSLLADESADKIRALGLSVEAGAFAENITTVGVDLANLPVGARLRIGECLCEVSQIGKECHVGCAIKQQTGTCVMPTEGIFTRVIEGGRVTRGDAIAIIRQPPKTPITSPDGLFSA